MIVIWNYWFHQWVSSEQINCEFTIWNPSINNTSSVNDRYNEQVSLQFEGFNLKLLKVKTFTSDSNLSIYNCQLNSTIIFLLKLQSYMNFSTENNQVIQIDHLKWLNFDLCEFRLNVSSNFECFIEIKNQIIALAITESSIVDLFQAQLIIKALQN